ncbi:MAG: Stf0 sulfotransferase [Actinomycetota bacterium]|jgi:hypothetical protein
MRVVVLAHPRSNSLVEILDRHPALSIINEPFNENFASWGDGNADYLGRVAAGEDFDDLIDELFAEFTGLKELSYQLDDDQLARLVRRPNVRVIALRRRNVLQTAVSQLIAEQTDLWKTWDADGSLEDHYRALTPLDFDLITDRMRWTIAEVARVEAALSEVDSARVLRVGYEDLYFVPQSTQDEWLAGLWSFLDLPRADDPEIAHFLSAAVKQARPSTYGRLPNLEAIEARFGNDATGHLDFVN